MAPTNREEFAEYCLRRLGFPVIEINLDQNQIRDRIEDAIQYFNEWHFDGSERLYMKHQITASKLYFETPVVVETYRANQTITGQTSGATAQVYAHDDENFLRIWKTNGQFLDGEDISDTIGNISTLRSADVYEIGEADQQYINIPSHIMSITKIFQLSTATSPNNYLFDPVYFHVFDLVWNFSGLDMISYELLKQRLNQIQNTFSGKKPIRFNRHNEKLYIDTDWEKNLYPNRWIIIECYRILDPEDAPSVWDNYFLKAYATALLKIQWGENLSKFAAIQLPGGVTLDGPRILESGKAEKLELEEQMKSGRWSEPVGFYVG